MEKVIYLDSEKVLLKATGFTPVLYKTHFKSDLFKDLMQAMGGYKTAMEINKNNGETSEEEIALMLLEKIDLSFFYKLLWVNARSADDTLPDMETWLGSFNGIPILEIMEDLIDLNFSNLGGSKKK